MRGATAAMVTAALMLGLGPALGGCSAVPGLRSDKPANSQAPGPSGPVARSQVFGTPFPATAPGGRVSLTLDNPRLQTSASQGQLLVVDSRLSAVDGRPVFDPADLHAFTAGGRELERLPYPKGIVVDPLVRTELSGPGQQVSGMVAWKLAMGERAGRVDYLSSGEADSLTFVRQPVNPNATTASSSSSGG